MNIKLNLKTNNPLDKDAIDFLRVNNSLSREIEPIQSDASKRKYYRLKKLNYQKIFMDSSSEKKSLNNFIKMTKWLGSIDLESPTIINKDIKLGYLIIKDLGREKFSKIIKKNRKEKKKLFDYAIKIIIHIYQSPSPKFLKKYSDNILFSELNLFIQWYCKSNKIILHTNQLERWSNIWIQLLNKIDNEETVVLRDFHVDNLIWIKNNKGLKKVGLLDFQDALIGHPAYDIVSLLQDVRLKNDFLLEEKIKDKFINLSSLNKEKFNTAYNILGAQRSIKIIGIFYRLSLRDKKNDYLKYIPNTWSILKKNLLCEELKDMHNWFNDNIPIYNKLD